MSSKKVKGSALYLEDGGLIFTPYSQNPQNSIWRKAIMVNNGKLRCTNDIVQVTLTADSRVYLSSNNEARISSKEIPQTVITGFR